MKPTQLIMSLDRNFFLITQFGRQHKYYVNSNLLTHETSMRNDVHE
jgi:hypothetical protein